MTTATAAQPTVKFTLIYDAYCDGGTGYTSEAQNVWLADSIAEVRRQIGLATDLPKCVQVTTDGEQVELSLSPRALAGYVGTPNEMTAARKWLRGDGPREFVQNAIAAALGRKAAYVTIR